MIAKIGLGGKKNAPRSVERGALIPYLKRYAPTRSMIVAVAMPWPMHMVCRP